MKPVIAAFLLASLPAFGWNATGHRIIAAIAYDLLTPAARDRVDDLIRRHPDYQTMFLVDAPSNDPAARARHAFIMASLWADQIKGDARFYDDDRWDARPTTRLPGYPDMARRQYWHYVNVPFSTDGTRLRQPRPPNVVTEIERLSRAIARPVGDPANPVYALPWILHLVGDIHNPLHSIARFSRQLPDGDRGGNDVFVEPGRNLHAFWDGLPGPDPSNSKYIDETARRLSGSPLNSEKGPSEWAKEGVNLAKTTVYKFGGDSGTRDRPIRLNDAYRESAKKLAEKQLATAGQRLADLLNRRLGR